MAKARAAGYPIKSGGYMNGPILWIVSRNQELSEAWFRLLSRGSLMVERVETLAALEKAAGGRRGVALLELSGSQLKAPGELKTFLAGNPGVSVIIVGAGAADPGAVAGLLEAGADDFISTTIDERVLLAKAKAHLRRIAPPGDCPCALVRSKNGEVEVDRERRVIRVGARKKKVCCPGLFTPKEFEILAILVGREEQVVSRGFFMEEIWKEKTGDVNCETIDKHVGSLRQKLGAYGRNIKTIYGAGYVYSAG